MAESADTLALIIDALNTAKRTVAILEGLREVAALPAVTGSLADVPRKIVLSQLCTSAAETTGQALDEIIRAHRSMEKASA